MNPPKSQSRKPLRRRAKKLILRSFQSPGDILMLTAAVRDLHLAHPGRFMTDVRTSCPDLWLNNPYLTPIANDAKGVRILDMSYPLVNESNQRPYHFLHGFARFLEEQLDVRVPVARFHGDIHLSDKEKSLPPPGRERGVPDRFWIILAGGKFDFTTKWWNPKSYQAVVDHFRGRVTFVQCGAENDWHVPLDGVVNLVCRTNIREFVRLMYHADGVVCPLTFAMHLAAAVETPPGRPVLRPCVVIAGGREAPHWTAYPHHQFLGVVGQLPCCATGGCWRSRCQLVGDGDPKDWENVCEAPVEISNSLRIPACMDRISPQQVIERIELHCQPVPRKRNASSDDSRRDERPVGSIVPLSASRPPHVRIECPHGAVPAVMFTAALNILRMRNPSWRLSVRGSPEAEQILRMNLPSEPVPEPDSPQLYGIDRIYRIEWEANNSAYADFPSTPTVKCLLEQLGVRPRIVDLMYELHPRSVETADVTRWLRDLGIAQSEECDRYRVILIDEDVGFHPRVAKRLQTLVEQRGLVTLALAPSLPTNGATCWRAKLATAERTLDLAELTALVSVTEGVIGGPNLPLYLAAATRKPALGVWRRSHPVHQFDLSDYVVHAIPRNHERYLSGKPAASLFRRQYRHRVYSTENGLVDVARNWLFSELPQMT